MNQHSDSDESIHSSEEEPVKFSNILRYFKNLQNSVPTEAENNLEGNKESRQKLENSQCISPPVPQKRLHQKILPPTPALRKTVKNTNVPPSEYMGNLFVNVTEENIELDQVLVHPPIPKRIDDKFSSLSRSNNDVQKSITPVPRAKTRFNRSTNRTTSYFTSNEEQYGISKVLPEESNLPLGSPQEWNITEERAGDPGGRNTMIKNLDVSHNNNEVPVNILQLRPKSANLQEVTNKGAIKRIQAMSHTTSVKPKNTTTSTGGISNYGKWSIEHQNVPKLRPKSLVERQMMLPPELPSSHKFSHSSSSSERLNELKFRFASTSSTQPDKYNKSIVFLTDIMIEAIQEKFSNDDNYNARYSSMRDFVHHEIEEYVRKNEFQNLDRNIPYGKLFSKIESKFIKNYVITDDESNSQSDEEEVNDKAFIKNKKDKEELQYPVTSEKITYIIRELKQTERKYLVNLETCIIKLTQRCSLAKEFSTEMVPIAEHLFTMQSAFLSTLEKNGDNLLLLMKTFLDFEDLFMLYADVFSAKMNTFSDKSISEIMNELKPSKDLAELLLNRLKHYRLLINNITIELTSTEILNSKAEYVIEMLSLAMLKCNNTIETSDTGIAHSDTHFLTNPVVTGSYISPEYGLLLLENDLKVGKHKNNFTVFLFEKIIVLSKGITREILQFENSLKLNQLILLPEKKNKTVFKLKDYLKSKLNDKEVAIRFEAESEEIQKNWRRELEKIFWAQFIQQKEESKAKP